MGSLPQTYTEGFHDVNIVQRMPYRPLGETGLHVSALSFGGSALGSVFRATDDSESAQVFEQAIRAGINYVDTAPWYGHGKSETVLGKVLPSIPRSSYYISTKVCRYLPEADKQFDFSAERTLRSVDESLARLNLDHVDVIQIHDMEFAPSLDIIVNETLPALDKVRRSGKAKFIGITGYPLDNFKTVLERSSVKIDSILTYCRGSMNDNALKDWIPYFKSKGVGIINGSPNSMGLLTPRGPPDWHPATPHIRKVCADAAIYCKEQGVDISRLAMNFALNLEDISTTMFSTASLQNLTKNLQSLYDPLTDHEQQVQGELMSRFMHPLQNAHWEGVEVARYREKLAEIMKQKGSD